MPELSGPLVAVLAYDGLCTFEYGIAWEVFGLTRPEMGPGWYRWLSCAVESGDLMAAGGLRVAAQAGLEALDQADLIVVPGWRGIEAQVPAALVAALQRAHQRGARLMSLCSGIRVLAATGLLDGRVATTHWRYAEAVARQHPAIRLAADWLYVDEGSLLTAAGSAAGIDLCLHVVRRDFGAAAANAVARRLVVQPHRDGEQAQFIPHPVPRDPESGRIGTLIDWLRANPAPEHSIAELAARAGMSIRTFQRRFEEATGEAPGAWLVGEKVRMARTLLEGRQGSLEDIALACGFGSPETMRHHFRRRVGISPSRYRTVFAQDAGQGVAGA